MTTAFICSGPLTAAEAHAVVLDVVPDPLVGVELRRVGRQPEQPQRAIGGVDELGYRLGLMHRVVVDDDEHRPGTGALGVVPQPLQEGDELGPWR